MIWIVIGGVGAVAIIGILAACLAGVTAERDLAREEIVNLKNSLREAYGEVAVQDVKIANLEEEIKIWSGRRDTV